MGEKKTKLMLYSTLVEVEVEGGVELGNSLVGTVYNCNRIMTCNPSYKNHNKTMSLGIKIKLGICVKN